MNIDLNNLTEEELVNLNRRIIERLRFIHQTRSHQRMLDFNIDDRVCFETTERGLITGKLTRYNKNTVTVITDAGARWTVAPEFLRRIVDTQANQPGASTLLPEP